MSILETLRYEYNTLKIALDFCKQVLAELNDERKECDADPEFDAIFALREAECNYYIAEADEKLRLLKNEIDRLEAYHRDN